MNLNDQTNYDGMKHNLHQVNHSLNLNEELTFLNHNNGYMIMSHRMFP